MIHPTPITASIPMIMEILMTLQIIIRPDETARQLCRRIGIYHPAALCLWPMRARLLPGENVYSLLKQGNLLYIHSRDFCVTPQPSPSQKIKP